MQEFGAISGTGSGALSQQPCDFKVYIDGREVYLVRMMLCPKHSETVPTCAVYSNGEYYCFTCQARGEV